MKKVLIAASVTGILLLGTVAWMTLTDEHPAAAQTTISDNVVEPPSTLGALSMIGDDTTVRALVDITLVALQGSGVLTPEAATRITAAIDDAALDLDTITVGDVKARIAELDWDSLLSTLTKDHHKGLTDHPAPSDGGNLPEKFHERFRERFHEQWHERRQQPEFSFDGFEVPEGFDLEQLIAMRDLFKELGLGDLDMGDLMDAFRNGAIDEFLGSETNAFADRWGAWLGGS